MTPFGDRAVRFSIPEDRSRRELFAELSSLPGVADVVLAEEIGCVVFVDAQAERSAVSRVLASRPHDRDRVTSSGEETGASHVVAVVYDGDDLEAVATTLGRSKEFVVSLHSEPDYRVAMLGFLPGFAYLRDLPRELRLPRRAPRARVPAGSVAIAAEYTGIYPFASPGGWHLLGRAPTFEPFGPHGAAFAIGDRVRFVPSSDSPRPKHAPARPPPPATPHLEIARAAGVALLVDGGRPGKMHEGVPPGGPLVRSLLGEANSRAGNAPLACAVELSGTLEVVARGGTVVVADETGRYTLAEGDRHTLSTAGRTRARYLALEGGIDSPLVLGGRGALLVAGIGALLRKGDLLVTADRGEGPTAATNGVDGVRSDVDRVHTDVGRVHTDVGRLRTDVDRLRTDVDARIAIMPGPDASAAVLDELTTRTFSVSTASDRTGTRLEGALLESLASSQSGRRRSTPMVIGAIELTPSGLIVLGPDHPTTGGYPVVAVVRDVSLDSFFARPIGAPVRFRLG